MNLHSTVFKHYGTRPSKHYLREHPILIQLAGYPPRELGILNSQGMSLRPTLDGVSGGVVYADSSDVIYGITLHRSFLGVKTVIHAGGGEN